VKFYIATGTGRIEDQHKVREVLQKYGHTQTYDWTQHGKLTDVGEDVMQKVCHSEMEGIAQADFVVVLLPGGRGTHGEVGMAAIARKPTFIHSTDPARFDPSDKAWCGTTFYFHDRATRLVMPKVEDFAFRVCQLVGKHEMKIKQPGMTNITPETFALWWYDEWHLVMEEEGENVYPWDDLKEGAKRSFLETAKRVLASLR